MKAQIITLASLLLALALAGCPGEPGLTADVGARVDGGADLDAPGGSDGGPGDVDTGPGDVDGGPGDVDGGPAPDDGGPAPIDVGPSPIDVGPSPIDAGPSPIDAGPAPIDAGPAPIDAGPAPIDGGPARVDAGPTGCTTNADCPATNDYCEKALGDCAGTGTCAVVPRICPLVIDPVCGCDGNDYGNACEAAAAGVNVASRGMCATTCARRPMAGCCFDDGDCRRGEECIGEMCMAGGEGTCHALPRAGECWEDADCAGGTCMGERICPCGALCILPDAPGACGTITPGP